MRETRRVVERVRFDVYGRFRVVAERGDDGWWAVFGVGADGTRARIDHIIVPASAGVNEVRNALEASYHELARPAASISEIDS